VVLLSGGDMIVLRPCASRGKILRAGQINDRNSRLIYLYFNYAIHRRCSCLIRMPLIKIPFRVRDDFLGV